MLIKKLIPSQMAKSSVKAEKSKLSFDLKNSVNQEHFVYITAEKSKEKSKSTLELEKSAKSTFECSLLDCIFVKSSLKKTCENGSWKEFRS